MTVLWMKLKGAKVYDQGYCIVPIKPGTKQPAEKAWPDYAHSQTDADVERFEREMPSHGIGILCARTPAVDIDVRDAALALELQRLAEERLGLGPARFGAPPKRLLVYQTAEPFKKKTIQFTLPGDPPGEKRHAIEILGDGQSLKINRKGCGSKDNILLSCVPRSPHFVLESATTAIDFQPLSSSSPLPTIRTPVVLTSGRMTALSTSPGRICPG